MPGGPPDHPGVRLFDVESPADIQRAAHAAQQSLDKGWNVDIIVVAYPKPKEND